MRSTGRVKEIGLYLAKQLIVDHGHRPTKTSTINGLTKIVAIQKMSLKSLKIHLTKLKRQNRESILHVRERVIIESRKKQCSNSNVMRVSTLKNWHKNSHGSSGKI